MAARRRKAGAGGARKSKAAQGRASAGRAAARADWGLRGARLQAKGKTGPRSLEASIDLERSVEETHDLVGFLADNAGGEIHLEIDPRADGVEVWSGRARLGTTRLADGRLHTRVLVHRNDEAASIISLLELWIDLQRAGEPEVRASMQPLEPKLPLEGSAGDEGGLSLVE